jgi:hypothetical protein
MQILILGEAGGKGVQWTGATGSIEDYGFTSVNYTVGRAMRMLLLDTVLWGFLAW